MAGVVYIYISLALYSLISPSLTLLSRSACDIGSGVDYILSWGRTNCCY